MSDAGKDPVESKSRSLPGRARELARLERLLADAAAARGRAVLIAGDPGIGKTTLAEAFSERAAAGDARVAWGRCWEAGGAPGYWPWIQALRGVFALPGVAEEVESVRPFVDVVATLVPEISGPGTSGRSQPIERDSERFALFDAVSRVLQTIAIKRPLVIILDDLHAADASSLLLLRFVARDIRSSRCLVVGLYREREAQADPVVDEMMGDIARDGEAFTVEGLEATAFDAVLENAAGVAPSDALINSLHQITHGNPFYATEILRLLLREGRIEPRLDLTRGGIPVPDSVSDTVLRRFHSLPHDVQEVLKVAAVIGRAFSTPPLAGALRGSLNDVRAALAVAERERVVRNHGSGNYVFDHGLIREALYESLSDAERAALHGRVAVALEAAAAGTVDDNLAEIAHHFLKASLDDARPPFDYAVRAARRAVDVFAYEQAVELFEEAIALAPVVDPSPLERSDLLRGLGECYLRLGRTREAKERLLQAAEQARVAGSPQQLVAAVSAYGYMAVEGGVVDQDHIDLIEEALDALPRGAGVERAVLLSRWGTELMLSGRKEDDAARRRMTDEALEMISSAPDSREKARVLRNHFSALLSPDTVEECMAVADQILQIGLRTRDPELQMIGRIRRAGIYLIKGMAGEMDAEVAAIQRLEEDVRQPFLLSPTAFMRSCIAGMRLDAASALKQADAALAVGPEVANAMPAHLLQHFLGRWEQDGGAEFLPFMRVATAERPGVRRTWRAAIAATLARVGQIDEARTILRETVEELPETPLDSAYMSTLFSMSATFRFIREPEGADTLYDALFPYRDQHMVQIMVAPVAYFGSVEWALGTLASITGRDADAEKHFETALREHSRVGARTYFAWTQMELAELLVRSGDRGDAARAEDLIREATSTAEELDLRILLEWARTHMPVVDPPSDPIVSRGGSPRMVREGEYVTLARGDEVVRLRHAKGLTYLAALLTSPGREIHVLDVAAPRSGEKDRRDEGLAVGSGDAGPLLDPVAKAAYRERVEQLRAEVEEAESFKDMERAARAREELDFIASELSAAVGLGGRDRKAASDAERARVNVTKRIKTAIDKISEGAPDLGRHLAATIKTGTYLSYSDRLEPTMDWIIDLDGKR